MMNKDNKYNMRIVAPGALYISVYYPGLHLYVRPSDACAMP